MKTPVPVFLCACIGIALSRAVCLAQDGFVPLLDDEHKSGWQHRGNGGVQFEEGVLTTKGKKQGDGFYCYMTRVFTDFVLKLEFKNLEHASNSGVFLRMLDTKDEKSGYEVQIDGDPGIKFPTGAIWGFQPPSSVPQRPVGEWNEMQIMVEGQKYRVALNGRVINEFTGNRHEIGYIGIQNHHDGPVQIRNVLIRELHTAPPLAASHASGSRPSAVPATYQPVPGSSYSVNGISREHPFVNSLGMKFVPVPGTQVLFCIHHTRRGDYRQYAEANPEVDGSWKGKAGMTEEDHPVSRVSWTEAAGFCRWLSQKEGLVYRLPTDREWSVAVGLGDLESESGTPESKDCRILNVYPWGSQWPPPPGAGNFADSAVSKKGTPVIEGYTDGYAQSSPVMSFAPNPYGLYDMSGNVWQWCEDWYNESRKKRVLRGNSWLGHDAASLLSSKRDSAIPSKEHWDTHGFRCVLAVPANFVPPAAVAATEPPASTGASDASPLFAAVPDAAQKALSAEAKLDGSDLAGFERIEDDGDVIYAGWTTAPDQTERDFTVSADGAVLSHQVVLSELPEVLQKAVTAYAVQDSVETIDRTFGATELATYQVKVKNNEGRTRQFIVDETGSLVSLELTEDQMPEDARKKLREQIGLYEIEIIDRVVVDADLTYHVVLKRSDGRHRDCVVAANGIIISSRVLVDEVPMEVGRAMLARAERGRVGRIDRMIEDGEVTYCFVVRHPDGRRRQLAMAADGRLLHEQVLLTDLSLALQRHVREQNAAGKLFWMDRVYEPTGRDFHYEIRGVREGRPYQFSMEPKDGRIIAEEKHAADEHSRKVAVAVAYSRHSSLHPVHHMGGGHAGGGGGRRR